MGIQINGNTDTISAIDGGLNVSGASLGSASASSLNISGIVTASGGFSGNVTGNITGNVSGNITGNISASGVSTFSGGIVVAAGSVSAPSISPSGDSNTGVFFPAADTIAIAEGGVEVIRINSAGLVGINSQSPSALLDICDTTGATGLGIKKTDGLIYFARSTGYSYATAFSELNSFIGRADTAGNHITSSDGGFESSANQMVIGHNGTGGILLGTTDAGPYPSGRMLIDADGRIRTPNQISFAQYSMSGTTFNSGTMSGGNSDHNVGGHYNTSTGIFTAPVTGYYQFGCGVLVETGTGRLEGSIAKNNSGVLNFNGTGTTYDGPTATCILYLSANDNVRIRRISGTAHGIHGNCYFWGRLLG